IGGFILFQSAPHFSSEANRVIRSAINAGASFNPRLTSAARRTQNKAPLLVHPYRFQSAPHFSSEANLLLSIFAYPFQKVSIRASLQQRGEPVCDILLKLLIYVSIRASLQQRGELGGVAVAAYFIYSFNPRLTSAARRTRCGLLFYAPRKVSIRASLQQRGEHESRLIRSAYFKFQSAPHFSSEANIRRRPVDQVPAGFNPRLTSAARRTLPYLADSNLNPVFQSAPHFSSEANVVFLLTSFRLRRFNPRLTSAARRTAFLSHRSHPFRFNPRLTSAARRTPQYLRGQLTYGCFNPRLTSAARRTDLNTTSCYCEICFNPRLTSAARRTRILMPGGSLICVSIRASLQQRGEPVLGEPAILMISFQSAPHFSSEANTPKSCPSFISVLFQSAPHFSSEANSALRAIQRRTRRFNPRLTSAARRTANPAAAIVVSDRFNPRITSAARRTRRHRRSWRSWRCFNPRLTSAARRTHRDYSSSRLQREVSIRASLQQRGEQGFSFHGSPRGAVSIRASLQQRGEPIIQGGICHN